MLAPAVTGRYYTMAIIRSLAIGKGSKSAGNITFRTVRGRTIVSEKLASASDARGWYIICLRGAVQIDFNVYWNAPTGH